MSKFELPKRSNDQITFEGESLRVANNEGEKEVSTKAIRRVFWVSNQDIGLDFEDNGKSDLMVVHHESKTLDNLCQKLKEQNNQIWFDKKPAKRKIDWIAVAIYTLLFAIIAFVIVTAMNLNMDFSVL